jgi:ABC-type antimicrobial peptide transport system permease subunit
VRFAFEPGRDRDAVPVRSALVGSILAVAIVVATLTFGNSLATLVSHPSLYGWNWNYVMAGNGSGVPPQAVRLLKSDPYVATWSGDNFANAQINGVTVPIILTTYRASVTAPILSGHAVDGPGQIVLGAQTMLQLHKRLGQTVTASYGTKKDYPVYVPPTKMTIVGTSTLPAIGGTLTSHTSMGVGAILPIDIEPPAFKKFLHAPFESLNGYSAIFVRLKKGAPAALARASLEKIAHYGTKLLYAVPNGGGSAVAVRGVQYPAEIENYRTIGVVPDLLALALAAGAVVALALTLVASVHRRRRDLALLRTLGFTRRQLMSAVAWQASVAGAVGIVAGIPIGVLCGRWLWTLFARNIFAVPEPTVPVVPVIIVAIAAMALANIVAALPGRSAAQTSTAQVLRGE